MIAEYSQISTRKSQTVFKVIRGDDTRGHGESSFRAEEGKCHVCGVSGHLHRNCKFFNKKYSLEQDQRYNKKKHKGDTTTEDTKAPEGGRGSGTNPPRPGGNNSRRTGGSNGSGGSNGGRSNHPNAHLEDSSEQSRVALELNIDAGLSDEDFSLICKCEDDVIDLLLDTGTMSNILPEDRRDLVQDIRDEHTSLIGVGEARVVARKTGEAGVFGRSKTSIVLELFVFPIGNSGRSSR